MSREAEPLHHIIRSAMAADRPTAAAPRHRFEKISEHPLAFVWRNFASSSECDALVARAEAAREFTLAEGATITYGVVTPCHIATVRGDGERNGCCWLRW